MKQFVLAAFIIGLLIGVSSQSTTVRCPETIDDAVLRLYRACMLNFEIRGEHRSISSDESNRRVSQCFVEHIQASNVLRSYGQGCSGNDNEGKRSCIADKIEVVCPSARGKLRFRFQ